MAIKTNGTLWGWGDNGSGQLGDGTTVEKDSPEQIGTDDDWAVVTAGEGHTLAIKTNGTLWAWGNNELGQLGDGTAWQVVPERISAPDIRNKPFPWPMFLPAMTSHSTK